MTASAVDSRLSAATRATYAVFILSGFAIASWATRIPQIRDQLDLQPSRLGLVLLAIAAGSLTSLLLAGHLVARLGSRRTVAAMAFVLLVSMLAIGFGYPFGVAPVVISLYAFGFAHGAWDVAMNVQAAVVERGLGRSIMPRFHAGFSVGEVVAALLGTAMIALDVSVTAHLVVVGVVAGGTVLVMVRRFVPDQDEDAAPDGQGGLRGALRYWVERRTLLIGVVVLAFAFAEGAGIDWIGIAVIDGYHAPAVVGTLAFATFLAAMTAGRWFGPALLDRYGRVPVVRVMAMLCLAGLVLFVVGVSTPVAFAGALLWGVGTSLGFPVGMSAAADDPARAAPRVSVVASIGYCAFLGGPPLVGFLGDHVSVLRALAVVAVLLGVAALLAGATRPPGDAGATRPPGGRAVS